MNELVRFPRVAHALLRCARMQSSTRVFFGFALSERDRAIMERAQRTLRTLLVSAAGQSRVRWVTPGDFHLTLRFIGVVPSSTLPAYERALVRSCSVAAPVAARSERLLGFPSPARARTLALGLHDPRQQLAAMLLRLEHELALLGIAPEPRPLVPHVTLARVSPALDIAPLANPSGHHDSEIMLSRLCLFESRGGRAENRYVPLSELDLTGEHPSDRV
jgi:RNA 2',3'-cyclic 3'-phosphodiesterase